MSNKSREMQRVIRYFKEVTGKREVDMREVAEFAMTKLGWKMPPPVDPIDRLARDFSRAAREEIRHDEQTGKPYRANHAYPHTQGGKQTMLWVDIDEAPRKQMVKSLNQRREQMVGDAVQLTLDAMHWSRINPGAEPIRPEMDFTEDVQWRLNAPDDENVA